MTTKRQEAVLPYKPDAGSEAGLKRTRDDFRIFAGWWATLRKKGEFKYKGSEILHKFLVPCLRELIREGSTEFHPEKWKGTAREIYLDAFDIIITKFRYLVAPHAEMIYKGRKKATVHARNFIQGSFVSIVGPEYEFGFARFKNGIKISLKQFEELKEQHRVSEEERKKWWPDKVELYFYKLRTWIPLKEPRHVRVPKGTQTYGERSRLNESSGAREDTIKDFEYLLHHVDIEDGKEEIHHCLVYDHNANLFEQGHLWIENGKVFLEGKEIKDGTYHIIRGLEAKQEVAWSDEEAEKGGIKPKKMVAGMTLKEKGKEW